MPHIVLFLRLFAEVADAGDLTVISERLKAVLRPFGEVGRPEVNRYWKVPAYFEVYFRMIVEPEAVARFGDILEAFGTGWLSRGSPDEPWAVWNHGPLATFFSPDVRWANVECFFEHESDG